MKPLLLALLLAGCASRPENVHVSVKRTPTPDWAEHQIKVINAHMSAVTVTVSPRFVSRAEFEALKKRVAKMEKEKP